MPTNILKMVENITKVHPNWKMLYRKLRVNDTIVESKDFKVPSPYSYKNLNLIERFEQSIFWTNVTVVGREGSIELHHGAKFDINGDWIGGMMNMFYPKGSMANLDKATINEYLSETKEKFSSIDYWDQISDEREESIVTKFDLPI